MIYSNNTYDITNDISTYTRRDFTSVYDTSNGKWYMLNNLDTYEEYGIYGTDFLTYYTGKLVIVNGEEYEWVGTEWDDLGAVVDNISAIYRNASHTGYITFPQTSTDVASIEIDASINSATYQGDITIGALTSNDSNDWRFFNVYGAVLYDCGSGRTSVSVSTPSVRVHYRLDGNPIRLYDYDTQSYLYTGRDVRPTGYNISFGRSRTGTSGSPNYALMYNIKFYSDNGETVIANYIPYVQNNTIGMFDTLNEVFVGATGTMGVIGGKYYPKEYTTKTTPTITNLWPSKLYRNSKYLHKLYRNDAEQLILDYMSEDKFKKGKVSTPTPPTSNAYIHIDLTSYNNGYHPYIDLGYVPTSTTNVEMTYRLASSSFNVGDTRIFGMNGDSALYSPNGGFAARIRTGNSPNYYFEPTYGYNSRDEAASITPLQDFTVRFDQTTNSGYFTFYMNGNNILQWNVSSLLNLPLYVFMSNNNYGNFTSDAPHPDEWLKEFKIYEGETLVCNFIPYIQNNVVGLYDTISGQFKAPTSGDMAYETL